MSRHSAARRPAARRGGAALVAHPGGVPHETRTPRLRVEQVGACLPASFGAAQGAAMAMARELPPEDGRMWVVLSHGDAAVMPELAERLQEWLPLGWDSRPLVHP